MERYTINNSNPQIEIKIYNLLLYYNNIDYNFFEFYLTAPHLLVDNTLINVTDEDNIDVALNTSVYLRNQIKIGINVNFVLKWRYIDDSNEWQDIGTVTSTLVVNHILPDYDYISTFSDYSIDYQINNGIVQIKETHSNIWQNLIDVSEINAIASSGTFLSKNSNIRNVPINDTYLRIFSFDLNREVNILKRGYNDDKSDYIFTTDYFMDINNIFLAQLKTGDKLIATLIPDFLDPDSLFLPSLTDPDGSIPLMNEYWMNQDWFNSNIASSIEEGKTYKVIQGSIVYNGNTYTINQLFQGTSNSSFDSFSTDAVVYIVNNPDNLYNISADPVSLLPAQEIETVIVNVDPPCESDLFYTFTITNLAVLNILPENIDILYKEIDLNTVHFWKEFGSYQIGINMETNFSINVQQSDLIDRDFFEAEIAKVINPIIDNERIRFEPYYPDTSQPSGFRKINCINFRLKFDDGDTTYPNTTKWGSSILNFTDEDVKYQKLRLKNTFLRLSYYNMQNPTVQLLEHYNTVFVDTNMMYADYVNNLNNMSGINPITNQAFIDATTGQPTGGFNTSFYVYNPYIKEIVRDVTKKINYSYTGSSEGYYIYLFGQEYKDLIPTDIFMKIEFNNAMTGKRTLFFNRSTTTGSPLNNVFFDIPDSVTPTSLNFVYIKFSVVYNKILDKFIYYPNSKYMDNTGKWGISVNNDIMTISLFEANVQ